MDYKDYYKILGVERKASEKDIKQAYRKLAREFHPDVNTGDKKSEAKFQEINEAYEVLSDVENRKRYDQMGRHWNQGGPSRSSGGARGGANEVNFDDLFGGGGFDAGGESSGFSSFFDRFFNQRRAQQQRAGSQPPPRSPAQPSSVEIEVSLGDCFTGTHRNLELSQETVCPTCGGGGVSGSSVCPGCRGSGRQRSTRNLEVQIPAGVTNGSKVRASDVMLTIKVNLDKDYELKGRDLIRMVPVDLYEAVLGSEVTFQTPTGKTVTLKIPVETQNGRQFRLAGQGLPGVGGKPAGDLYVKIEVRLPGQLTPREKELFQELARLRN
jgi:molecular chaperone DnaJ